MKHRMTGFTLLETVIAVALSLGVLLAVYALFSAGVRGSMKGQDTLDTIAAAGQLFSELRRDIQASNQVQTPGVASLSLSAGATSLPANPAFSPKIVFSVRNATITYSLADGADRKHSVRRVVESKNGPPQEREFGVARLLDFKAVLIGQKQAIPNGGAAYTDGEVMVVIELDSKDRRFPTQNLRLTSFFNSNSLSSNDWNYFP